MNPFRRLRSLFRRRRVETEMAEEMRFHLEQRAADLAADGLSPEEARYAAQRKFGNVGSLQEQGRDARGWGSLERLVKELQLAVRQLTKSPGFTLLAIATLGLGIGANIAGFSMFNDILLKPLPYPDSAHLARLYRATAQNSKGQISPADFLAFKDALPAQQGEVAGFTAENSSLSDPGRPAEFAYTARATVNLLSLLGVRPQLGRDFSPGEDAPGRDRVVILSQRTWFNRYGGDPAILGQTIRVDGEPHVVIGVLPPSINDWRHLGMVDFFRPLAYSPEQARDRGTANLRVIVRRAPGHSATDLAGFVANFGARQAKAFPEVNAETTWRTVALQKSVLPSGAPPMIGMMVVLSGLVLLIACSNLANLLLARTMARAREFAVRAALGASRTQLLRPLIAESLLLAFAGGVCAFIFSLWIRDYMAMRTTGDNGEQVVFALDWHVFAWALFASLVTAVMFGIAPALFALRLDLNQTLKSGGRGATGGRGHQRFRSALIIGQFAIAMTLLAAAGVQIRGLHELINRRSGWDSEKLVLGTILLPTAKYPDAEKMAAFHRLTLERLAALPGVASASLSSFNPIYNWPDVRKFVVEGRERPQPGREPAAVVNTVSPRYFDTMGTSVLTGRVFNDGDHANSTKAYILGQSTARALFGEESPVGRRLAQFKGNAPDHLYWGEVVGVVSDVESVVTEASPVTYQIYQAMAQEPRRQSELAVRTVGIAPVSLADSVRAAMAGLDPDLPIRDLKHADLAIERANYQSAVGRDIISAMAVLGLALASLGIYGIIARTMAQRTGEFAIRLALGASLANITRIVLTSGVKLALLGSALGLLGAYGAIRIVTIEGLPNQQTNSALIVVGTTLLLITVALVACWIPARRARKIDAMQALRAE